MGIPGTDELSYNHFFENHQNSFCFDMNSQVKGKYLLKNLQNNTCVGLVGRMVGRDRGKGLKYEGLRKG